MRSFITALFLVAFPLAGAAHHSRAEFSGEVVEIAGELLGVNWSNPHPTFTVSNLNDGKEGSS